MAKKQAEQSAIGGIDMHAMVNQLRDQKNAHETGIENLTLNELREKVTLVFNAQSLTELDDMTYHMLPYCVDHLFRTESAMFPE